MSTNDGLEPAAGPRIVEDVVCTSCACLCDDIQLRIEGDRISEARNACPLGRERFLSYRAVKEPVCMVSGWLASIDDGVDLAARLLTTASYPLFLGLEETTCEAQRAAVSLAEAVGACVDAASVECCGAATLALQSVGEVTCTLGEIKNRADLIIVWRADPIESHPRLFSRYALEPAGTSLTGGRTDRYCVIVDVHETRSVQEAADQFIAIRPDGEFEALWVLRALARGIDVDSAAVESETGVPLETWQGLVDRMRAARYGVIFYATGASSARPAHAVAQAIHSLTRELNAQTRFVCMPLHEAGNLAAAQNVLAWQTGYPSAVSLSRGYPRYSPGEFSANDVLRRGEMDLALIVSGGPLSRLSVEALRALATIPCILLGSTYDATRLEPTVMFQTAFNGVESFGTVYRMDGVPLPLRPALASPSPRDADVLRAIEEKVRSLTAPGPDGTREGQTWR